LSAHLTGAKKSWHPVKQSASGQYSSGIKLPQTLSRKHLCNCLQNEFLLITLSHGNAYIAHVCRSQPGIDSNSGMTWPGQIQVHQFAVERHFAKLIYRHKTTLFRHLRAYP
jgi:hypothetical protein